MFWMLLPPPGNAGRHLSESTVPLGVHLSNALRAGWRMFVGLFASPRR